MLFPALALFIVSLGYGVVVPLLPALSGGRNATNAALVSLAFAAYASMKLLTQVPGGVWVDRKGALLPLRFALFSYALSLLVFALFADPAVIIVARAVEGASTGLLYPAALSIALERSTPERAGRRIGTVIGIGTSGLLIGPVLGALLGKDNPAFPVWVALALTMPLLLFSLFVRSNVRAPSDNARTLRDELSMIGNLASAPFFLLLLLPMAFNKLTFSAFQGIIPLIVADAFRGEAGEVTILFVLIGALFGVAQPIGGALSDRFGSRRVILFVALPLLASLIALSWAETYVSFVVFFSTYVFAASLAFSATMKDLAHHSKKDAFGGTFGVAGTLTDTMTIAGPLLFVNAYAALGPFVFLAMAITGIVFFGMAAGFRRAS